ncbi:hypothetical protein IGI04_026498, partial [Brassica rapa subsp. trilocularis]
MLDKYQRLMIPSTPPLMAEALAIRLGITMAATLARDFQFLKPINNKTFDKEIYGIVSDIHHISSMFNFISFSYICRSENLKADKLAKLFIGLHSDVLDLLM